MAVLQGKRPFLWAQPRQVGALDATKSAVSNWHLAISQNRLCKAASVLLRVFCGTWFPFAVKGVRP
jgi:hypothetical protein